MANCTSRHCTFPGEDRLTFLVQSTKEDIMTFLKWMLDIYPRIKKRSSVHEYWRVWCMLYRKSVGCSLHAEVAMHMSGKEAKGTSTTGYQIPRINRKFGQQRAELSREVLN